MELGGLTFIGLATIGVVNVVLFFKPNIDQKVKFGIAFISAFAFTFVPAELGNILLDKAKIAIEVAFASSGGYKLISLLGGALSKPVPPATPPTQ